MDIKKIVREMPLPDSANGTAETEKYLESEVSREVNAALDRIESANYTDYRESDVTGEEKVAVVIARLRKEYPNGVA